MNGRTLDGIVRRHDGPYTVIECPDAPEYLRWMNLTPWQAGGRPAVGTRVTLEYRTSASYGLWFVSETTPPDVLTREEFKARHEPETGWPDSATFEREYAAYVERGPTYADGTPIFPNRGAR